MYFWPTRLLFFSVHLAFASSQSSSVLPSWNVKPSDVAQRLGSNASLSCRVDNAGGRSLAWTRSSSDGLIGGDQLLFVNNSPFNSPSRYFASSSGVDGDSTLHLTSLERDDDAVFKCNVQASQLSSVAHVTVLVNPGIPLITLNVSDDNLVENVAVQLSCDTSGGNPPPMVKWFRNGIQLPNVTIVPPAVKFGKTSGIVVWTLRREDFGANFTCTAENRNLSDSLVSNGAMLLVKYAPVISLGPYNPLAVLENSSLRISCNITAYPEVNSSAVYWFKDEQFIKNGTSFTLSPVSVSDAGVYTCSARNFETKTANLTVDVQYPPKPPPLQVFKAVEGSVANLTIAFYANPPVDFSTMKWYNGSNSLVSLGRFLILPVVTRMDAGNYTVEATNTLSPSGGVPLSGVGRASLQLKVSYKPGQAVIAVPLSVVVGQTVEMSCSADDLGYPIGEFNWFKVAKNETYPKGNILRIVNAQLSDIGNYSCAVQNEVGYGRPDTRLLDIYEPAKWIRSTLLNKSEVLVNGTLDGISCIARGRPAPIIQWYKDGHSIDADWFQVITESHVTEDFSWNSTSTLKWEGTARKPLRNSLRPQDAGIYSCHASVSTIESQRINQTIEIIILYPPLISTEVVQMGVDPGAAAFVLCSSPGFPFPSYTWQNRNTTIKETEGKYAIETFTNGSKLTVLNMTSQDLGIYFCQATNVIGSSVMTFNLTLNSIPSRPTQLEVLSKTWESVELSWVPGYDGGIPQQFLVYFQSGKAPVGAEGSSKFNLSGLYPNTTYIISVESRNRLGVSSSSNSVTLTTDAFILPVPDQVKYHKDSKILSCTLRLLPELKDYCLQLQLNTSDYLRRNYSECNLESNAEVKLDSELGGIDPVAIAVSLCLKRRLDICSNPQNAEFVTVSDLPVRVIIIVCCVCGGSVVILLILLVVVCCWLKKKRKSYADEQRTIDAFDSNATQTEKEGRGPDDSLYAAGIDNPTLHQMEPPTIIYGKKGPYIDLYPVDRSDSHGSYGSDSGVSVSEIPKTKRIIHEVIV